MKVFVALLAVVAMAAANPLPLVQIVVNVDAPGRPDAVAVQPPTVELPVIDMPAFEPPYVELPVIDMPVEGVIIGNPKPKPPRPEIPEVVIIPDPVVLPEPVLPVPAPTPEVLPQPVLPDLVVPELVVLPEELN